jgi:hypothetical protein
MNASVSRTVFIGVLFLLTLAFGIWLSHAGKPYSSLLFNIHKLIALGAVIVTALTVYQARAAVTIGSFTLIAVVATGLLFVALFVSGALLSIGQPDSAAILIVHRVAPWLVIITAALTMYSLSASQA